MSKKTKRAAAGNERPRPQLNEYVAVGLYASDKNAASLLAVSGKVVLFDTVAIAQQFLPLLGEGRQSFWDKTGESIGFLPIVKDGINRAVILTGYNPYDLPANLEIVQRRDDLLMPVLLRSETAGKEWRQHIMFTHAFFDCGQWKDNGQGERVNTLLEAR